MAQQRLELGDRLVVLAQQGVRAPQVPARLPVVDADGRMKGIAFIKDPDGYWIEILSPNGMTTLLTPGG